MPSASCAVPAAQCRRRNVPSCCRKQAVDFGVEVADDDGPISDRLLEFTREVDPRVAVAGNTAANRGDAGLSADASITINGKFDVNGGRTVTWKVAVASFPAVSIAVQVTVVVPTAKRLSEGGTHSSDGSGSTLSLAETV